MPIAQAAFFLQCRLLDLVSWFIQKVNCLSKIKYIYGTNCSHNKSSKNITHISQQFNSLQYLIRNTSKQKAAVLSAKTTLENCGGEKVSACGPGGDCTSKHYKRGKRQGIKDNPTITARDRQRCEGQTKELTVRIPQRLVGFFRFHRKLCSLRLPAPLISYQYMDGLLNLEHICFS